MSETLTISLNEFRALLRKAFEGIYGHSRDWNALADTVLWLEFHGLNGLQTFISSESELGGKTSPSMQDQPSGEFIVQADGQSLLAFNEAVGDLVIGRAKELGHSIMQISGARNADTIVASVARCVRYNLAAAAWWPGGEDWAFMATQDITDDAPHLCRISLPEGFRDSRAITLIAGQSLEDITSQYPNWFAYRLEGATPANKIAQTYLKHLDHGFSLSKSDYERLCYCADRVLVEATEQSRLGAGD